MDTIKVKKEELLSKLKENRTNHRQMFETAQKGYKEMVIEELEKQLDNARKGKTVNTNIHLVAPKDQTKDYDRAIAMLEMDATGDLVELDQSEFSNYVLDDWSWKQQFTLSNSAYLTKAGFNG